MLATLVALLLAGEYPQPQEAFLSFKACTVNSCEEKVLPFEADNEVSCQMIGWQRVVVWQTEHPGYTVKWPFRCLKRMERDT